MINVFIDTSIFVSEGYLKGKSIATLLEAARAEKIHILMPDITEHEIRKHLRQDVEKLSGRGATQDLKKSFMYALDDLRPHIEALMDVTVEKLLEHVEKELDKQFVRADIERLSLTKDFDIAGVLEDYKALRAPFSTKKKSEFPDAIALKQLENWCADHNDKCIVLSTDTDLENYESERLTYQKLSDFVASLEEYEKMISQEKLNSVFEICKNQIEKQVKDWVYEQYEDEVLFIDYLLLVDIHSSAINTIDIQWDMPFKWEGKEEGCLFYKIYANITASISVSHPDYDTGYYDSEDRRWYFIDDNMTDYLEGRIRIPVSIEYLYGSDDMEVESINFDKDLSRTETMESLVSVGRREFDEDFEVDYEICPHCNAEVMIFEYPYPGNENIKETKEIVCPKCNKHICTKDSAWYYRAELMEHE